MTLFVPNATYVLPSASPFEGICSRRYIPPLLDPPSTVTPPPPLSLGQGGFGTALMCKDLGLAQAAAAATSSATPLGGAALQIYRLLVNHGLGPLDFSAVYKYISENQ